MVYKNSAEGVQWERFFKGLIATKAYYFLVAQGRGTIEKSVLDFLESE